MVDEKQYDDDDGDDDDDSPYHRVLWGNFTLMTFSRFKNTFSQYNGQN